jgi:hypothetical protein
MLCHLMSQMASLVNTYFNEDIYSFASSLFDRGANDHDCHCTARPSSIANCQTGDCDATDWPNSMAIKCPVLLCAVILMQKYFH